MLGQVCGTSIRASWCSARTIVSTLALFSSQKISRFLVTSNLAAHAYGVLNLDENKNKLYSLSVNREMNFLTLISL